MPSLGQSSEISDEERRRNTAEALKRGLFTTRQAQPLLELLAMNPHDAFAHFQIKQLLEAYKDQESLTAPFYKRLVNEGEILIGKDPWEPTPQLLRSDEVTSAFIGGTPGSGKTTLLRLLATQVAKSGCIKVLLVDSEKEELRSLQPIFAQFGQSLHVFDGRHFPFNPLDPEKLDVRLYFEHISSVFGDACQVGDPSIRIFKEGLYQHLENSDKQALPAILPIIREFVARTPGNQHAKEAVLSRLDAMILATPGFNYKKGESTKRISENNIVLECSAMDPAAKQFLIGAIILREFLHRKLLGPKHDGINWIVFVDDGQKLCANPDGPFARLINIVRAAGIAFHIFAQSSRGIAPSILDNAPLKLCGILASADELQNASRSMNLSREQISWMSNCQKQFQWVVQLAHGWRRPFLIETPPSLIHEIVATAPYQKPLKRIGHNSNAQVSQNRSVFGTELIEAVAYRNWSPFGKSKTQKKDNNTDSSSKSLTENQIEFLQAVARAPGRPCSTYNEKVSCSQRIAIATRKKLIALGLIREEHVKTQEYGRTAKLVYLTKDGEKAIGQENQKSK